MTIDLASLPPARKQYYLQHAVAPRPIALASTIDREGRVNLSPFSFFNLFSSNPPVVIFSPARRVRDNTTKHTLQNVEAVPEVTINLVSHAMVQQASLSSCEYGAGVDEFEKAGFAKKAATRIQPPLVAGAPAALECRVLEVKSLGSEGGAGQLVICEVLVLHLDDAVLDAEGNVDQAALDLVARLGGDLYCRANRAALFTVPKPNTALGMGIDALPESIRQSRVLTGNHLGMLANVTEMPLHDPAFRDDHLKQIVQYYSLSPEEMEQELHLHAAGLLEAGRVADAWQVLLAG